MEDIQTATDERTVTRGGDLAMMMMMKTMIDETARAPHGGMTEVVEGGLLRGHGHRRHAEKNVENETETVTMTAHLEEE